MSETSTAHFTNGGEIATSDGSGQITGLEASKPYMVVPMDPDADNDMPLYDPSEHLNGISVWLALLDMLLRRYRALEQENRPASLAVELSTIPDDQARILRRQFVVAIRTDVTSEQPSPET